MLKNILHTTINCLLPLHCIFCQQLSKNKLALCKACAAELPWLHNTCYQCANPLRIEMHANEDKFIICGNCHKNPPLFNRTISVLRYQSPITQVIARLKFGKKLVYSELLAQLLCEKLSSTYQQIPFPQAIIPIPLHARRLRERGYNQVIEIARSVSKTLKIPVLSTHCIKNRATLAQSTLVAKKRAKNIKNAFSIKKPIDSQYVAILDDVVTTGSTVRELSAVLLRAGVKKIDVWCCARTSLTHF